MLEFKVLLLLLLTLTVATAGAFVTPGIAQESEPQSSTIAALLTWIVTFIAGVWYAAWGYLKRTPREEPFSGEKLFVTLIISTLVAVYSLWKGITVQVALEGFFMQTGFIVNVEFMLKAIWRHLVDFFDRFLKKS